jgi:hypothetical protein
MSGRAKPSLFDIIFVIWVVVIPVGFGSRLINSDGDTARHLRLGEMILQQGHLPHTDTFSFTMAGKPFIAFEWGSEAVFALAYRLAGLPGVAVLAGLVLALTYALVARFLIRRGGDPLLAYFVSMGAAVLSAAHWLARPHLFTMLAVVLLLELLERPGRQKLWPYFALFVVWANLHGGFFFGCVTIGIYLTGELVEAWLADSEARTTWMARAAPRDGPRPRARGQSGESQRLAQSGARGRLLRQQRDTAADPGVHEPRFPHHQRKAFPADAARGGRDVRPYPPAAQHAGAADRPGQHRLLPYLAA